VFQVFWRKYLNLAVWLFGYQVGDDTISYIGNQ